MSNIVQQLRFKLFDARKHNLPMPNDIGYSDSQELPPKDIEDHLTQELDRFNEWLVQKYWDENT